MSELRSVNLHIALLGTRGIPARYSGFETCAEQLAVRLVRRGHRVTVYCRTHHQDYRDPTYNGVRLVYLPNIRNKYLDTLAHTFISSLHALGERYDVVVYFIAGNSPVAWIPRLAGQRVVINVDGLDWRRAKWPGPAKRYLQFSESFASRSANAVVTDSRAVVAFYERTYGYSPLYIPYGSEIERCPPGEWLARLGLVPGRYIAFVGRLVPENCAHHLVDAFRGLETDFRCVIVGDAPYADEYRERLRTTDDPRVVFTGYVFGAGYSEIVTNSYAFVETSEVGGTHPALVEAMSMGTAVVVNGTPENRETVGDAGIAYDSGVGASSLRGVLRNLLSSPRRRDELATLGMARARSVYSWEVVTEQYEALFRTLVAGG